MELSIQPTVIKNAQGQNPILINYNSNRIREYYHSNTKNKNQSSISSSVVHTFKGQSMNKIQASQQNSKIDVIKLKCFKTSKLNAKTLLSK